MNMHKEEYERLLKRFALELSEVGVSDNLIKIIEANLQRAPNMATLTVDEPTDRFTYRHNGYMIEAKRTVEITVKKCT
tara:strand:+ start:589 stop:822 length:234 start_codon:yes stop_codon:yes gene_type:complete